MRMLRLLLGAVLFVFCLGPVIAQDAAKAQQPPPATPAVQSPTAAQTEDVKVPESYVAAHQEGGGGAGTEYEGRHPAGAHQ